MRRVAVLVVIALAGCGGGEDERAQPPTTTVAPAPSGPGSGPRDAEPGTPFGPDDGRVPDVPDEATGPARAADAKVVRAWAAAVKRADFDAAADLFAEGALVANGGAPERLRTRDHMLVFNATLPCGAVVTALAGADDGFTIADFRLTDRVGATCGSGRGNAARVAFQIRRGKIVGWYRLATPEPGQAA